LAGELDFVTREAVAFFGKVLCKLVIGIAFCGLRVRNVGNYVVVVVVVVVVIVVVVVWM
jgi:Na+/glutamate symporter